MNDMPEFATPETQGFWEGCAAGELRLQRCNDCSAWQFPPRAFCQTCRSNALSWEPVTGRGRLASFTEVHRAPLPEMREAVPYLLALVELEEGPMMMSNLVDTDASRLRLGMALEAVFGRPGLKRGPLPLFRLRDGTASEGT
ncbi:MAG: Zn-ribbon domain-containing OB-fold protein [Pararhodobacter sp.]|nr:Zn-ribbon domain-containing OB-fold protein [Pararhodobacter sp.]